ncbi:MAG TPA: zinc ABC transporter substrate-binding protein [Phycisphaerales bacterium]|nr:zinc ABC transporter substrate-binding protein [Phycisphaerales bacterium]
MATRPLPTWALFTLALVAALLSGCDRSSAAPAGATAPRASSGAAPLEIVATTGMIADVVRAVAGERAAVTTLMGPGVDPHLYRPSRSDVAGLMSADAVFYNGLLLEGRMTDTLVRLAGSGVKVFAVTELLEPDRLLEPEDSPGHPDPHVWMDPAAWARTVDVVRDRLTEIDPEGRSRYARAAADYAAELKALDAYAERVLASVPETARVLVTAHDAFNYFGRRYGYGVVGIQGISTESEAGIKDIENLVSLLVERKVGAVFVESTVPTRNIEALIAGARARGHEVRIGGELYSDAMGPGGTYEGTYAGMIDHNVTTIARALGGEAPAGGMRGKLTAK